MNVKETAPATPQSATAKRFYDHVKPVLVPQPPVTNFLEPAVRQNYRRNNDLRAFQYQYRGARVNQTPTHKKTEAAPVVKA